MDVATEASPSVETDLDIKPEPEEKPILTPPASIEADKPDGSIDETPGDENDMEEDDLGEITPDHYYGGGEIPVFKPVRCPIAPDSRQEQTDADRTDRG